jgi:hypothetical protein
VANVKITGYVGGVPFPFPLNPQSACGNYGIDCPIKPGNKYDLSVTLPILKTYPPFKVKVKLQLRNADDKTIICLKFPAQIQD